MPPRSVKAPCSKGTGQVPSGTPVAVAAPVVVTAPVTAAPVVTNPVDVKKRFAQFFSTNADYIFQGFPIPSSSTHIVEPFAGRGDLVQWAKDGGYTGTVDAFDIIPQHTWIRRRDTLITPPSYTKKWIVTNPPYIARNKTTEHRGLFDSNGVNDLYKVFLLSLISSEGKPLALGGYVIIPLNFLCSMRPMDNQCRERFFNAYTIRRVNFFEESVFEDTACTVIAMWFEARVVANATTATTAIETEFKIHRYPTNDTRNFVLKAEHKWLAGGEIYSLPAVDTVRVTRYVKDMVLDVGQQLTKLVFNAIDSGSADGHGRIGLAYSPDKAVAGLDTSRTYATLVVSGVVLTVAQQQQLATQFNTRLNEMRDTYWSMFLTNYRESKDYARKRAPFQLCYLLVRHLLSG